MKTIEVAAAIIKQDNAVLATQRAYGEFKDGWEFPGGKIEAGETPEEALTREIAEELDASIKIEEPLCVVDYDYPAFHLHMHCFACSLTSSMTLLEHEAMRWVGAEDIDTLDWLPADIEVVQAIKQRVL